jgi:hypothetical protein
MERFVCFPISAQRQSCTKGWESLTFTLTASIQHTLEKENLTMLLNTHNTSGFSNTFTVEPNSHHSSVDISRVNISGADNDLRRRVQTFLSTRHRPGLRSLEVEAQDGVVTLRGRVATFHEKQISAQLARRVAGVVRLVDQVIVKQPISDRRQGIVTVRLHAARQTTSGRKQA